MRVILFELAENSEEKDKDYFNDPDEAQRSLDLKLQKGSVSDLELAIDILNLILLWQGKNIYEQP